MEKKSSNLIAKILLIILILLLLATIIVVVYLQGKQSNNSSNKDNLDKQLEELLDTTPDCLIYLTSDNCQDCDISNKLINYYEKNYSVNFQHFNLDKISDSVLDKRISEEKQNIQTPAIIVIKNEQREIIYNNIINEELLKSELIKYGFLDETSGKIDNRIDNDSFKEIYSQEEKQIIFLNSYDGDEYENREKILKLSEKYNFNYSVVSFYNSNSTDIYDEVAKKINIEFDKPLIIITQNNDILDYSTITNQKTIYDFLNKNKMLNN